MAASSSSAIVFTDVFVVSDVDKDGKKFDRVSRVAAKSNNLDMKMTLDINTDLLDLQKDMTFSMALASTLNPEADKSNAAAGGWRQDIEGGLADDWEYIMHGKVYKFDEGTSDEVTVYVSFGGLLMALTGSYRHVSGVTVGEYIYLLVRK
ncbi:hypothetical protein JCM16303_007049 [Sporobolomyces ruberrimus]